MKTNKQPTSKVAVIRVNQFLDALAFFAKKELRGASQQKVLARLESAREANKEVDLKKYPKGIPLNEVHIQMPAWVFHSGMGVWFYQDSVYDKFMHDTHWWPGYLPHPKFSPYENHNQTH